MFCFVFLVQTTYDILSVYKVELGCPLMFFPLVTEVTDKRHGFCVGMSSIQGLNTEGQLPFFFLLKVIFTISEQVDTWVASAV